AILDIARSLASGAQTVEAIAQACFEWVRDEIHHSVDYQLNPVTCRASEVLQHKTGYCYAKSHLLAALLRANHIPTGFCCQRFWQNVWKVGFFGKLELEGQLLIGWGKLSINPFAIAAEADFPDILPEPLTVVIELLQTQHTWDAVLRNLPDATAIA
ncbi:MAG: transglutaminase-like domain-containing protein, partial [Cyanobacteria bacterium J06636_16]